MVSSDSGITLVILCLVEHGAHMLSAFNQISLFRIDGLESQ